MALAISPAFSKEKEETPVPPPLAKTGTTMTFLDQPVEITLHLAGRIVEPLSFLIRKEPKHGKLSALRRVSRNSAVILYTPNPGTPPGDDFFSFAAQSVDSAVSAPATVWIRLAERPPVLEFPAELDFGKVFLGDEEERPLRIGNSGGAVATGALQANPPWRILKSGEFRIPAGTEAAIPLLFAPWEERDFSDKIQIGKDPKNVVSVRGSGVAPVSWPKEGLVVSPTDRTKTSISISFTNHSPSERQLTIEWPEFLKAPRELLLPPDGSALAQVEIRADPSLNDEREVAVRSGNFSGHLPLRIFPAPPKLSITPERELKLATAQNGHALQGKLSVKNIGGSKTSLEISAPPWLQILPNPSNILVSGGTEQVFELHAENGKSVPLDGILRIQAPGCHPVEISLRPPAVAESRAAVPVENFLRLPPLPEPVPTTPPAGTAPSVESARLVTSKPHEVEIRWEVPSPKISGFRIERRRISPGKEGQVAMDWLPWSDVSISIKDQTAFARFENLAANTFWIIRIISLDENGAPSAPSPSFRMETRPVWKPRLPGWAWLLLTGSLGGVGLLLWKKRQHTLHLRENKRITHLESQ